MITQRQLSSLSDRYPVTTIALLDNTEVFNAVLDRMWHDHMFFFEVFIDSGFHKGFESSSYYNESVLAGSLKSFTFSKNVRL